MRVSPKDQFPKDFSFPNFGFDGCRIPGFRMPRHHRHHEIEILFAENGGMKYLMGGEQVVIPPDRFAIFWASTPHQLIECSSSVIFTWVTIPLGWFLQWQFPKSVVEPLLHGKVLSDEYQSDPTLDRLLVQQWAEDFATKTQETHRIALLEIEARLRRFAHAFSNISKQKSKETSLSNGFGRVAQMARFIAEHYTDDLKITDIADTVGLHPNYAMRLFQKTCKASFVDYITRYRVLHAQRLLATSNAKIIDIGFEAGFGSASQFYLAFKNACGKSPRAYRVFLQKGH